jgi:hypothetical protein
MADNEKPAKKRSQHTRAHISSTSSRCKQDKIMKAAAEQRKRKKNMSTKYGENECEKYS